MPRWRIISDTEKDGKTGEPLCWSDGMGWVAADLADSFDDTEKEEFLGKPEKSKWTICPNDA